MNIWEIDAAMKEIMLLEHDEELVDLETGEVVTVEEAIAKLEMARDEKIENAALMVKNMTAQAEAIKAEEEKLKKRRAAIEGKTEGVKRYLIAALTREDGTSEKFTTSRAAVSIKTNAPRTVITDEKAIPEEFFIQKVERRVDKVQLKEVLQRGIEVPGAALERGRSVVIK